MKWTCILILCHGSSFGVNGHGYLKSPISRNYFAYKAPWWPTDTNTPRPEDCVQCLNIGGTAARCGKTSDRNYDLPKNGVGTALPNVIQETYIEGSTIDLEVVLTAHHKGHFEYKACPISPGEVASQACFDEHPLTFIEDNLYGATLDVSHPERAYIPPVNFPGLTYETSDVSGSKYSHKFRLPLGLSGSNVLIQWHYITANDGCIHQGYAEYNWPPGFQDQYTNALCPPLSASGGGTEQFWNCAEVQIIPQSDPTTTTRATTTITTATSTTTTDSTATTINTGATISHDSMCSTCHVSSCAPDIDSKPVGEECVISTQCASSSCFRSICECRIDSDCRNGEICDRSSHDGSEAFLCIAMPTKTPTGVLTPDPTNAVRTPTLFPTRYPSVLPTSSSTTSPTANITRIPTIPFTNSPTPPPTYYPTDHPKRVPTVLPTSNPTRTLTNSPTLTPTRSPDGSYKATVIAYYASWQWYDRNKLASPSNLDFTKVDRVNFAFFQTNTNGDIWGTDSWADPQLLFGPNDWNPPPSKQKKCSWDGPSTKNCATHMDEKGLIHLAHASGAEIYPSLGGWTLSDAFVAMAASPSSRTNFANKCIELIQDYGFDGIDIDWEYPGYVDHSGTPDDKENFNLLLDEVRSKLDTLSNQTGKKYGLTAALPCGPDNMANMDIPHVNVVLDELNLMSYDFHGAWDTTTGINAPLVYQGWGTPDFSVDDCVRNWIQAGGSREKINLGMSFYGRSFAGAKGLNEPHTGADKANWGVDEGTPQYYNILAKLPHMTSVRDDLTKTQYAYFDSGGLVSFDDERSICEKTEYAIDNSLNGFLIWELSGDLLPDLSTPLLDSVNTKLGDPSKPCSDDSQSTNIIPTSPTTSTTTTIASIERDQVTTGTTASTRSTLGTAATVTTTTSISTGAAVTSTSVATINPPPNLLSAVEFVLDSAKDTINNKIFLYQKPNYQWEPSSVYRYDDFLQGIRVMVNEGVAGKFLYLGDSSTNGHIYGLVSIAAFVAQSMKETIKYNACDENSWDFVNNKYPLSNSCGQLGQSYQNYHCSEDEKHMECPVDPNMEVVATTNAKWYGAPAPLFCGPKSKYPFTGFWNHNYECNKGWANPPEFCDVYEGQKAGQFDNRAPYANTAGRTDVEGCCWWGRGVIQTTGVCNFGKLNFYLGKRAHDEGRDSRYPSIDFCKDPGIICSSPEYKELKWIAGLFYWIESVQSYNVSGWDYITQLHKFVDGGMHGNQFINSISGIVNRGCHNPPCATGDVDGKSERSGNFFKVLDAFGLSSGNNSPGSSPPGIPTFPPPTSSCAASTGMCGPGKPCENGDCCSQWGYCGKTQDYCGRCCQSNCSGSTDTTPKTSPSPPTAINPTSTKTTSTEGSCNRPATCATMTGSCGPNISCPNDLCCSQWGYCGTGFDYCGGSCCQNGPCENGCRGNDHKNR